MSKVTLLFALVAVESCASGVGETARQGSVRPAITVSAGTMSLPAGSAPSAEIASASPGPAGEPNENEAAWQDATSALTPVLETYPSTRALCDGHLKRAHANQPQLRRQAKDYSIQLGSPKCLWQGSVPFPATAAYKSLRMVRLSEGLGAATYLVVETPRGLVVTPIAWNWDDPLDPGCPSIVRPYKIERPRVDSGYLVVDVIGKRQSFRDDGTSFEQSVRGAVWCKDDAGKLSCFEYQPSMGPSLDSPFTVGADGKIHLVR